MDIEKKLKLLKAQDELGIKARVPCQLRFGAEELEVIDKYRKKYGKTFPDSIRSMILGWKEILEQQD